MAFLSLCSYSTLAWAGGGPENVLLVVNPWSASSLTIANHYIRLRRIPPENVLYLPWPKNAETGDIDSFRQRILLPVLQTLQRQRLANHIDYVVYSSGFPWGISLDSDLRKFVEMMRRVDVPPHINPDNKSQSSPASAKFEWPKHLAPVGSLNGLTYLWQSVLAGQPSYIQLQNNHYMRLPMPGESDVASASFRSGRQYDAEGQVVASGGQRYFLSTMLGVTSGRGNSVDEVIRYLKRSAAADGTHPKGTIYFVKNGDVRSKVRHDLFPDAVRALTGLGVAAEIIEGTVPLNRDNVQGVVMGTPSFDWKASGSTILPGAICEHFTSFGGIMAAKSDQTPLSEFLRYGAAGASGTVVEPFAIPAKFPVAMIQVHYARGCTLAEAFYQSVYGPYQLLIVGDPLCRPWADIPRVSIKGVEPGATVRGKLVLTPTATVAEGESVAAFLLFADGQEAAVCKPGETLSLDTTKLADGHHELRVVAIGAAPIESQGRQIIPVKLDNHGRTIEATLATQGVLRSDKPIAIAVRSPKSVGIVAIQGSRIVGRVAGDAGQVEIPAGMLGAGPVELRVAGLGQGGSETNVFARPLDFAVEQR